MSHCHRALILLYVVHILCSDIPPINSNNFLAVNLSVERKRQMLPSILCMLDLSNCQAPHREVANATIPGQVSKLYIHYSTV